MSRLDESGMSIGDFAMSLMNSNSISNKVQSPEVARPKELPISEVDISEVTIPGSMVEQVLQESFGMGAAPKRETVKEQPLLSEQELLQEKITSLKSELVETINKLSSLVSEMASMGAMGVTNTGGGFAPNPSTTKKSRGSNKRTRTFKRPSY